MDTTEIKFFKRTNDITPYWTICRNKLRICGKEYVNLRINRIKEEHAFLLSHGQHVETSKDFDTLIQTRPLVEPLLLFFFLLIIATANNA